jgi:hypothetical protein
VFAAWAVRTLGVQGRDAVVDVAGGKGWLAGEVRRLRGHGVGRVLLVDPFAGEGRACHHSGDCDDEADVGEDGGAGSGCEQLLAGVEVCRMTLDRAVEQGRLPLCDTMRGSRTPGSATESCSSSRRSSSGGTCVLLAMHPDEATCGVVEHALAHRLPFAVVPCCTYASKFDFSLQCKSRKRAPVDSTSAPAAGQAADNPPAADTNPNTKVNSNSASTDANADATTSSTVRKYGAFLRYLRAKHAGIRATTLPFQGRNIVLYITADGYG